MKVPQTFDKLSLLLRITLLTKKYTIPIIPPNTIDKTNTS